MLVFCCPTKVSANHIHVIKGYNGIGKRRPERCANTNPGLTAVPCIGRNHG